MSTLKILAVGGGSGGHVTPIAPVLKALRNDQPHVELRVWCDKKFYSPARESIDRFDPMIAVETIISGKFRRYHSLPIWRQLLRLRSIVLPNIRDGLNIIAGTIQSIIKLLRWKPDVIFCKGGYVCLPVGIAARILSIPVVLHDSDAHPGLTNRALSKRAAMIATGAPLEHYNYPAAKARYVGIPIDARFKNYTSSQRAEFKRTLGFSDVKPLVVITGGGLGAEAINTATMAILDELLGVANVVLISGKTQYKELAAKTTEYQADVFQVHAFVSKHIVEMLAAADLIVTRAGATTLLELAALAKPTIIVPNPYLTGGHQLKNADVYHRKQAGVIIDETQLIARPHELLDTISALVLNPDELARMSKAIHQFAKPQAAADMATLIIAAATKPS